jgi:hypothetical protein
LFEVSDDELPELDDIISPLSRPLSFKYAIEKSKANAGLSATDSYVKNVSKAQTDCSVSLRVDRPVKRSDFVSFESSDDDNDRPMTQTDLINVESHEKLEANASLGAASSSAAQIKLSVHHGIDRPAKQSDFISLESSDDDIDPPVKRTELVSVESSDDDNDCGLFKFLPLASRIAGARRSLLENNNNNNKAAAAELPENSMEHSIASRKHPSSAATDSDCGTGSYCNAQIGHTISSDTLSYAYSTKVNDYRNVQPMKGLEHNFNTSKTQQKPSKGQDSEVLVS